MFPFTCARAAPGGVLLAVKSNEPLSAAASVAGKVWNQFEKPLAGKEPVDRRKTVAACCGIGYLQSYSWHVG